MRYAPLLALLVLLALQACREKTSIYSLSVDNRSFLSIEVSFALAGEEVESHWLRPGEERELLESDLPNHVEQAQPPLWEMEVFRIRNIQGDTLTKNPNEISHWSRVIQSNANGSYRHVYKLRLFSDDF